MVSKNKSMANQKSFTVCQSAAGFSHIAGGGGVEYDWVGFFLVFPCFPLLNHIKTEINTNVTNIVLYMQATEIAIRLLIMTQVRGNLIV